MRPDEGPGRRVTARRGRGALLLTLAGLLACRGGINYESPSGPRYGAPVPACSFRRGGSELLRDVSLKHRRRNVPLDAPPEGP